MDRLHPPQRRGAVNPPQLRIAANRARHRLHCLSSRLTRPAAQLVLIGPPGTGKITLSHQIILIEAVEPGSRLNRAWPSARNFISVSIRFAVQKLKLYAEPNQNRKSISENASEHWFEGNSSSLR